MRQQRSLVFWAIIIILASNRSSAFLPNRCWLLAVAGMKKESSAASSCATANNEDVQDDSEVLKLPESTNDPSIPSIQLGETITFEEMGPVM